MNPPASAGDIRVVGSIPGSGRSPGGGHGNHRLERVRHDWSDLAHTHSLASGNRHYPWNVWALCIVNSNSLGVVPVVYVEKVLHWHWFWWWFLFFFFFGYNTKNKGNKNENKLMKLKTVCPAKEAIKIKRQPTTWKKMFANHLSDKGLIFKVHKEPIQLNSRKKLK